MDRQMRGEAWRRSLRQLFQNGADTDPERLPSLSFTWTLSSAVGETGWDQSGKAWARINLHSLSGFFPTPSGQQFFAGFACLYLAQAFRTLEGGGRKPQTYLEGLARLEALFRRAEGRRVSLCCLWRRNGWSRHFTYTPLSLFCAFSALEEARARWEGLLSPPEAEALARRTEELAALADLPETGYRTGVLPESTLVRALEQAGTLLTRHPDLAEEPGPLAALSWNRERLCTPEELLVRGEEQEDPLCLGIALRLMALSGGLTESLSGGRSGLARTAGGFRRSCARLAKLCLASGTGPLVDALMAAEKIAGPLNRSWALAGLPARLETVRPMGDAWRI